MGGQNQEWQLASYPAGRPAEKDFKCVDVDEPRAEDLKEGEVLLEAAALSVDPYMRLRMQQDFDDIPRFKLNEPLSGIVAGYVKASRSDKFKEGDACTGLLPFRVRQAAAADALLPAYPTEKAPITQFLGILGLTGLSAYLPIKKIARPRKGEVVFVTGAAGAVGSVAIQIFKKKGCYVVASAGTDAKTRICKELGADVAFNYKSIYTAPELDDKLRELVPQGIDIFFDNTGGRFMQAAINNMAKFGRIICCGAVADYNAKPDNEVEAAPAGRSPGAEGNDKPGAAGSESDAKDTGKPGAESESDAKGKDKPDAGSKGKGKPGAVSESDAKGKDKPGAGSESDAKDTGKPGAESESDAKGKGKQGAGSESDATDTGKTGAGSKSDAKGNGKPGAGPESDAKDSGKPGAGSESAAKSNGSPGAGSEPDGYPIKNAMTLIVKSIRVQGFMINDWISEFEDAMKELTESLETEELVAKETVVEGFDMVPSALVGLLSGENVGKMVVSV
ncbi:putative NADP-dependent oxidoreductase YfmJ [Diplonema papillatum]|nr:putative NADP-dependent oxidoreductase YfmJ [Diplonema papillatum]